ncbi:hypothetical protein [Streptomyces mobaraensis]|uniref:Uncharacterized protein n=1 Tax=Streptomyces mobaraensis TaxID=35621 RepID=A0A5N5W1F0_STRMB|nr:hypothetical protein [Streptomyces mobaraensis]KAB7835714.1 hypothetical protein FRZ00_26185 [Streptomyces mobaraensis]
MKTTIVSSAALLTSPWSSVHHMPLPGPSGLAQDLMRSYRLIERLRQSHQAEGSAEEWQSVLQIITDAAAARARANSSYIENIRQFAAGKTYLIDNGLCHEER